MLKSIINIAHSFQHYFAYLHCDISNGTHFTIKLFGGDGSSTTFTDVAVCIKSPLHCFTSKFCDK